MTNGHPENTRQRPIARVRTPYGAGGPLKRPARWRVKRFAAFRYDLIERYGLTDPRALTDAYDLASLFVEWRQATLDLAIARRLQEAGQTPTPSVRTAQRRLGIARKDYNVARKAFEAVGRRQRQRARRAGRRRPAGASAVCTSLDPARFAERRR